MKNAFYGETGSRKGLSETPTITKHFLTFTLSVNKIIIYQFSMFKSLDSIASVVGIFMYLTISKFKQVLRSRKGLDYNTVIYISLDYFGGFDSNFLLGEGFGERSMSKTDEQIKYTNSFNLMNGIHASGM